MKMKTAITASLLTSALLCQVTALQAQPTMLEIDFADVQAPWQMGFADYPMSDDANEFYELNHAVGPLPEPLQQHRGLYVHGRNNSGDLFMFAHQPLSGLKPNHNYQVNIRVIFATNTPYGCAGIGGAPGEHVFVKAGVSEHLPEVFINDYGWYQVNVDIGKHDLSGEQVKVIGDIANSQHCDSNEGRYEMKSVMTQQPIHFTSNDDGNAWVLLGTDALYESWIQLYYVKALIELTEQD